MKAYNLKKGDKVAIVSLSRGLLGMPFCKHELDLGIKRLEGMGLVPVFMDNALKDMDFLANHPEARAADLKQAFMDDSIKGIICAIGGDDTYKIIPYLMEDEEFKEAVKNNPKLFTGYSDTTNDHLMLNRLGLSTFYGPNFMVDIAELANDMLPYTKKHFDMYFNVPSKYEIVSSDIWYNERESYGPEELGKDRKSNKEEHGYEVLNGSGTIKGKLYGGCLDSIYDDYTGTRHVDEQEVFSKYGILPTVDEWKEKVLFLETSDEKMSPEEFNKELSYFKEMGIFNNVKGILFGKPDDEKYYDEYKDIIKDIFKDIDTPVLYNMNFGHSSPRCIMPYDMEVEVDYDNKKVVINDKMLDIR